MSNARGVPGEMFKLRFDWYIMYAISTLLLLLGMGGKLVEYPRLLLISPQTLNSHIAKGFLIWRDSKNKKRCVPAVISRLFPRLVDIVAWPVQRRFAYRAKFQKLFNVALPVVRAKQLGRSMKKTASCKKATKLSAERNSTTSGTGSERHKFPRGFQLLK